MIIITSAAFVNTEMQVEFGDLPPSFLPIGSKKLFEHQVKNLRKTFSSEKIYLSIPNQYEPSAADKRLLAKLGVDTVSVPDMKLGASLVHVIEAVDGQKKKIRVLHGDTLLMSFPKALDVIGVAETQDFYDWEIVSVEAEDELVWCGYFAFADAETLVANIKKAKGNFVEGVKQYGKLVKLKNVPIQPWHDLGHTNSYYKSRAAITTQRAFNQLKIKDSVVYKTGSPSKKIKAEANWFSSLPVSLKKHAPQLIDKGVAEDGSYFYAIEYLYQLPLNELFVHGRNPSFFWSKVFSKCDEWFEACRQVSNVDADDISNHRQAIYKSKTNERLKTYSKATGTSLKNATVINGVELPSLQQIADECIGLALSSKPIPGIHHGDFCFSNILFDSRAEMIKVIDPRGMTYSGVFSNTGDLLYDFAKLTHSVIGLYDYIISGAYSLEETSGLHFDLSIHTDPEVDIIQENYMRETFFGRLRPIDVMPHTVLLFLSMLPLHNDDTQRQRALLANALRLYKDYVMKVIR